MNDLVILQKHNKLTESGKHGNGPGDGKKDMSRMLCVQIVSAVRVYMQAKLHILFTLPNI